MEWTGTAVVGGGISTFYGDEGETGLDPAAILAFFDDIKDLVAPGVTWTIPNGGDMINPSDGSLAGVWSGTGGGTVVSTGSGAYAAGVGARIAWGTAGVVAGRRVRGSTFIVPLTINGYGTDGTLNDTARGTIASAAGDLLTALGAGFVIWSRPAPGRSGSMHAVTSTVTPDRVSWLRSRRT